MLVAAGQLPIQRILDDFKIVAMNKNENHELNANNPDFTHSDGWGIVIGKSGKMSFYKKAIACWEDPKYLEYFDIDADFLLLHARKASPNVSVNYSFTHPFRKDNWFFCHNGTVKDFVKPNTSDSKTFFALLLDRLKEKNDVTESIKDSIKQLKEYTALNFILANKRKAYVLNKFILNYPKYYSMKFLVKEDFAIVSSEILGHFKGWLSMGNDILAELDISTHQIKTSQIV
jgi:predicted glutamine amidotransferase